MLQKSHKKAEVTLSHLVEFPKNDFQNRRSALSDAVCCESARILLSSFSHISPLQCQLINRAHALDVLSKQLQIGVFIPRALYLAALTHQAKHRGIVCTKFDAASSSYTHIGPNRRARELCAQTDVDVCSMHNKRNTSSPRSQRSSLYCYSRVQGKLEITKQRLIQVET
jgi:hypothetical protein